MTTKTKSRTIITTQGRIKLIALMEAAEQKIERMRESKDALMSGPQNESIGAEGAIRVAYLEGRIGGTEEVLNVLRLIAGMA